MSEAKHTPPSKFDAREMFEVDCPVDITFLGGYGDTAKAYADEGVAVSFLPEDRQRVIAVLSKLLDCMKAAPR